MSAPKVKAKPKGLDRPSTTKVIKVMSALHTRLYRATGGRIGKNWRVERPPARPSRSAW